MEFVIRGLAAKGLLPLLASTSIDFLIGHTARAVQAGSCRCRSATMVGVASP